MPNFELPNTASTPAEDRRIVTPYAFGVSEHLLGTPLATPWQRGFAQVIDLAVIAFLTSTNALVLAFFVAATFFKYAKDLQRDGARRALSRTMLGIGTVLLFLCTLTVVNMLSEHDSGRDDNAVVTEVGEQLKLPLLTGLNVIAWSSCESDFACFNERAFEMGQVAAEANLDREQMEQVLMDIASENTELDNKQLEQLRTQYFAGFDAAVPAQGAFDEMSKVSDVLEPQARRADDNVDQDSVVASSDVTAASGERERERHNLLSWIESLVRDFGVGLGWAALYYSAFTAWFRGKTPGKWLMKIKVVKLNGEVPTLWESFGRYGGYTAGVATGLSGFLQVFWDANRQAIHDKISETLVIKV